MEGNKLTVSQPCTLAAKKADSILDCVKNVAIRSKAVVLELYSTLVRLYLECCVQYKNNLDILEEVKQNAIRIIKVPEYLMYKESLRKLGLFSLGREGLRRILSMLINT